MAKTTTKDSKQLKESKPQSLSLKDIDLLARAKRRLEEGYNAVKHDFETSTEDLKFCNNEGHWDERVLARRQAAGSPCLVFNHSVPYTRDVIGEQKESRPHTIVKPVGSGATQDVAKILEDHLRNRKQECRADDAYDIGFGQQLRGGFGNIAINTEWTPGKTFNQTFVVKPILNQNTVIFDDNAEEWHKNDGEWMVVLSEIDREVLEDKYDAPITDFDGKNKQWYPTKSKATVAEYYEKEYYNKFLYQLNVGTVLGEDELPEGVEKKIGFKWPNANYDPTNPNSVESIEIIKKRKIKDFKIMRSLLCGHKVLEQPSEWPCKYWRVVPIDGDTIIIDGKIIRHSLVFFSKDSNKAYNMSRCTEIEALTMVPKASVWATPAMVDGHEEQLNDVENTYVYKLYNPDPMMPGMGPHTITGIDGTFISAIAQSSLQAKEEIRQTIGPNVLLPRAANSLPSVSGSALSQWTKEGDVATYIFRDNLQKSIEQSDRVCVALMQRILDTEQTITCRKMDGSIYDVVVNERILDPATNEVITQNDLTVGEYTVETSMGPSYASQRAEIGDKMLLFVQTIPALASATADLLASMLFDMSQAGQGMSGGILDAFVKRVKRMNLQSGVITVQDLSEEEKKEFTDIINRPPAQPSPEMVAKLRTETARAMELATKAQKNIAEAGSIKAETSQQIIQLLTSLGQMAMMPQMSQQDQMMEVQNAGQGSQANQV